MHLFAVRDIHINNLKNKLDQNHPDKVLDDVSTCCFSYQIKRIYYQPLETTDTKAVQCSSWKGRCVCLIKFFQTLPLALYQIVKNILVITSFVSLLLLNLLNVPFSSNARQDTYRIVRLITQACYSITLRPIVFLSDTIKLLFATFFHPSVGIRQI